MRDNGDHDAYLDVAEDSSPNYLRWIADMCRPHLGNRVLEVGAGTGSITEQYANGRDLLVIDPSDWCVAALRRRFAHAENVTVRKADLDALSDSNREFDSAVMINVLEHIEDDVAALRTLRRLLRPGGRIVLYVPALNGLYGAYDRKVGHFRRYAPWRMREIVREASLEPIVVRYVNALAIPAWLVYSHTDVEANPSSKLALWDRVGVPMTRLVESRVRLPFGLNLFCVARVPD